MSSTAHQSYVGYGGQDECCCAGIIARLDGSCQTSCLYCDTICVTANSNAFHQHARTARHTPSEGLAACRQNDRASWTSGCCRWHGSGAAACPPWTVARLWAPAPKDFWANESYPELTWWSRSGAAFEYLRGHELLRLALLTRSTLGTNRTAHGITAGGLVHPSAPCWMDARALAAYFSERDFCAGSPSGTPGTRTRLRNRTMAGGCLARIGVGGLRGVGATARSKAGNSHPG